jgi:phage portal protein BeeE
LQSHIEEIEEALDAALGIGWAVGLGTQFDTDNLLRMDTATLVTTIKDAVGAGVMAPNEGREKFDLQPVLGGESPYLQQQNYSLEALAKRDAQLDPFAPATPPMPPADSTPPAKQSDQAAAAKMLDLEQRFGRILRTTYNEAA